MTPRHISLRNFAQRHPLRPPTLHPGSSSHQITANPNSNPGAAASPLPPDPVYDSTIAGLTKTRDDTLAALGGDRTRGLLNAGYTATTDAAGNVTGLAFDPSSSYSQAALALKHYRQSQRGNRTGMAARGHLYSGALQRQQEDITSQYQAGDDQRQKQLLGFLARNQDATRAATTAYEAGAGTASATRIANAATNSLYNPAAPVKALPTPAHTPRKKKSTGGTHRG